MATDNRRGIEPEEIEDRIIAFMRRELLGPEVTVDRSDELLASELLDSIVAFRQDAHDVASAIGRVDWLTKRWMIDQLGPDSDWTARKKIDLRYHELSESGYYQELLNNRPELRLVDAVEIDRRRKSPPASSPAARRGWLIREFADSEGNVQSEWSFAIIGRGKSRKRFEFSDK